MYSSMMAKTKVMTFANSNMIIVQVKVKAKRHHDTTPPTPATP